MGRKKLGARARGPYPKNGGYVVYEYSGGTGNPESIHFDAESDAETYVKLFNAKLLVADATTETALEAHERHLREIDSSKETITHRRWGVRVFYPKPMPLFGLRPLLIAARYDEIIALMKPGKEGDEPEPFYSAASHRGALAELKVFLNWCVAQKWLPENPANDIKPKGKVRKRKQQLRFDSTRVWFDCACKLAGQGDEGAVAALLSLGMALRVTEIVTRKVGSLDRAECACDTLWLDERELLKSDAAERCLEVPPFLRPFLEALTRGRPAGEWLFPSKTRAGRRPTHRNRKWVLNQVQRICALSGVEKVTAHGMRGRFATLARRHLAPGIEGYIAHTDLSVTDGSYAALGSAAAGEREEVLKLLQGGKK